MVDITARRTCAHGKAQNPIFSQRHGAGQSRHFAIVHHLKGDIVPRLLDFKKKSPGALIELLRSHTPEKRGNFYHIIQIDPRRAPTDGLNPRQVCRRFLQRIHDALEMILRVRLKIRVPARLLAENHFAINHGGGLAVAAPQIKSNPAAIQVPSERGGVAFFQRQVFAVDNF